MNFLSRFMIDIWFPITTTLNILLTVTVQFDFEPESNFISLGYNSNRIRIFYQNDKNEASLPICLPHQVCNKIDYYDKPWIEKQCRCNYHMCPISLTVQDSHSIKDKTRIYKTCESVESLPTCKYFYDVTWTYQSNPDNTTQQVMHCKCPKYSVGYIIKKNAIFSKKGIIYQFHFACSPETANKLPCHKKQPCRLFTVKKRHGVEEVNMNSLCQCNPGNHCPRHHTEDGVLLTKMEKQYIEALVKTYSAYCIRW